LDFRGTLGIDANAPVGFSHIRLCFELDCDATAAEQARLIELTERYCIIYQTLSRSPVLDLQTESLAPGAPPLPEGVEGTEEAVALLQARLEALRNAAAHAL
jgi:hypothetical protein